MQIGQMTWRLIDRHGSLNFRVKIRILLEGCVGIAHSYSFPLRDADWQLIKAMANMKRPFRVMRKILCVYLFKIKMHRALQICQHCSSWQEKFKKFYLIWLLLEGASATQQQHKGFNSHIVKLMLAEQEERQSKIRERQGNLQLLCHQGVLQGRTGWVTGQDTMLSTQNRGHTSLSGQISLKLF